MAPLQPRLDGCVRRGAVATTRQRTPTARQRTPTARRKPQATFCSRDEGLDTSQCFWSVVVPTYNRLPVLRKCLDALHEQDVSCGLVSGYEVVVVDDGSTDGTVAYLTRHRNPRYARLRVFKQDHAGAAKARNLGVARAAGHVIVFIDSDLIVTPHFLESHAKALYRSWTRRGNRYAFTYGRVINTCNFEDPTSARFKLTDNSAAYFATGNVSIAKEVLEEASERGSQGPFDDSFSSYGWEDLELGERLRKLRCRLVPVGDKGASGYHYHPAVRCTRGDIDQLVEREKQRGENGAKFYRKHKNMRVKWMVQLTRFHLALWWICTCGGLLSLERRGEAGTGGGENRRNRWVVAVLKWLCDRGLAGVAAALLTPMLNWVCVQAAFAKARELDLVK